MTARVQVVCYRGTFQRDRDANTMVEQCEKVRYDTSNYSGVCDDNGICAWVRMRRGPLIGLELEAKQFQTAP